MKSAIALILVFFTGVSFGQSHSDLKDFVDSVALRHLKLDTSELFKIDSVYAGNLKDKEIVVRDLDNSDPYPLIIINKVPFEPKRLKKSLPHGVKSVAIMKPEQAVVLFGSRGKYGAIILEVKKKLYKELKSKP